MAINSVSHPGVLARYEGLLLSGRDAMLSLGEGDTLVRSTSLEREVGAERLYFKLEGCNPTGSFKDRSMVLTMAKGPRVRESGRHLRLYPGNTSASAAAYAARMASPQSSSSPEGYVALGKLAQAMIYGARVILIRGNFDEALNIVRRLSEDHPVTVVNSINRFRIEGQKSGAFEICDELGDAPDYLAIPVGNLPATSRPTGRGFGSTMGWDVRRAPQNDRLRGRRPPRPSSATKWCRIPRPSRPRFGLEAASWELAVEARRVGGTIDSVTDEEILETYQGLAQREALRRARLGRVPGGRAQAGAQRPRPRGRTVVCILTGNGLKDPDRAVALSGDAARVDHITAVERALGWA